MSKIPFTLDAWLENKSQKVETRSGKNVRIICWDKIGVPIVALIGDAEDIVTYNRDGTTGQEMRLPSDLFIITPEPELSEFEKALEVFLMNADSSEETFHEEVKKHAAELLALARDQFIKDGYVIEKKAFHDAVEKVAPEVMKEVSDKVDMEEAIRLGYEKGMAEALKDLPRWEKAVDYCFVGQSIMYDNLGFYKSSTTKPGCRYITLESLGRLPGFNE